MGVGEAMNIGLAKSRSLAQSQMEEETGRPDGPCGWRVYTCIGGLVSGRIAELRADRQEAHAQLSMPDRGFPGVDPETLRLMRLAIQGVTTSVEDQFFRTKMMCVLMFERAVVMRGILASFPEVVTTGIPIGHRMLRALGIDKSAVVFDEETNKSYIPLCPGFALIEISPGFFVFSQSSIEEHQPFVTYVERTVNVAFANRDRVPREVLSLAFLTLERMHTGMSALAPDGKLHHTLRSTFLSQAVAILAGLRVFPRRGWEVEQTIPPLWRIMPFCRFKGIFGPTSRSLTDEKPNEDEFRIAYHSQIIDMTSRFFTLASDAHIITQTHSQSCKTKTSFVTNEHIDLWSPSIRASLRSSALK